MRVLMCEPRHFTVEYEINQWMDSHSKSGAVNRHRANKQWQNLKAAYERVGFTVELIKPNATVPDQVFTANGALVIDGKAMLPRFLHDQRQPETALFQNWLEDNSFSTRLPDHNFEGEGDALVFGRYILAGYGFRSALESHAELASYFTDYEIVSLKLVDPRFYHVDTCLTVLDSDTLAYYPFAFDKQSQQTLRQLAPNLIEASEAEAVGFGLNSMSNDSHVFMSSDAPTLIEKVRAQGFNVHSLEIDEFRKSGGGIKCLTLTLRS